MPEPRAPRKAAPRTSKSTGASTAAGRSRSRAKAGAAPDTTVLDALAEDVAEKVGDYIKEIGEVSAASVAKIRSGTYQVEDIWSDGIKLWGANMKGMASAFKLGTSAAQTLSPEKD